MKVVSIIEVSIRCSEWELEITFRPTSEAVMITTRRRLERAE